MKKLIVYILILSALMLGGFFYNEYNKLWKITAYCSCKICCGIYADKITASGESVRLGIIANNWLEFGSRVKIEGLGIYTVKDRGSEKYFGTKKEKRKAIDVYFNTHKEAEDFGVKYLRVKILRGKK